MIKVEEIWIGETAEIADCQGLKVPARHVEFRCSDGQVFWNTFPLNQSGVGTLQNMDKLPDIEFSINVVDSNSFEECLKDKVLKGLGEF